MTPEEMAAAYTAISDVNPPAPAGAGWFDFADLPLVRSVDPRQHDFLATLGRQKGQDSEWEAVRIRVAEQRELRSRLYEYLRELEAGRSKRPSDFVFPDAYSLLLWIWTFQLFAEQYASPLGTWTKYLYRGEARDYGATKFLPKVARPGTPPEARNSTTPARIRGLLHGFLGETGSWYESEMSEGMAKYMIGTMSCAQALAVAQHYGYPTPLLDVTAHPEVALYFATLSSTADVGVVGHLEIGGDRQRLAPLLSLVVAPPLFVRIRLQSGYFICPKQENDPSSPVLTPLRFRHHPSIEPIAPTWVMSVGPVSQSVTKPVDLLTDSWGVTERLRGPWPDVPTKETHLRPAMVGEDVKVTPLLRLAFTEIVNGAGRQGMTDDGKRFNEVDPTLMYTMVRHAPVHTYMFAAILFAAAATGQTFYLNVLNTLLQTMRIILASYLVDEHGYETSSALALANSLDARATLTFAKGAVGGFDEHRMPWPLNSWYEN